MDCCGPYSYSAVSSFSNLPCEEGEEFLSVLSSILAIMTILWRLPFIAGLQKDFLRLDERLARYASKSSPEL